MNRDVVRCVGEGIAGRRQWVYISTSNPIEGGLSYTVMNEARRAV